MTKSSERRIARFGAFEVEMDSGILRKHGVRLRLQGKPFQILEALLERPGEVVTRDELRNRLWAADTFVDFESGLNTAANRLRFALGDSAENPRYVETVSRTGYRFIGILNAPEGGREQDSADGPVAALPEAPEVVANNGRLTYWLPMAGVGLALIALLSFRALKPGVAAQASFRRITFRQGTVSNARFGPESHTILYSAQWDAGSPRIYEANTVSPESRQLEFDVDMLAGVSPSAELGLLKRDAAHGDFTLSRVPVNGGAPLGVLSGVSGAEWGSDGFAIFRDGPRESSIEYPPGKVLYKSPADISDLRLSPAGDWLAFVEHPLKSDDAGAIKVLDRGGNVRELSGNWASVGGLAWTPSGQEVWFTAARSGVRHSIFAAGLNGKLREVASLPGMTVLYDIAKDGRVLLGIDRSRMMIAAAGASSQTERDLSWFDWSHVEEISADGRYLLLDETGEGGGPNHSVYLRDTQTGKTVRLGEGQAVALSPDLKWALSLDNRKPDVLTVLPVAGDAARTLSGHGMIYSWGRYFPDGKSILAGGHMPGKPLRLYVQSLSGGAPVALNPEIYLSGATISPDGKTIAGSRNRAIVVMSSNGGEAREIPTPFPAWPIQWSADGGSLYVRDMRSRVPVPIVRIEVSGSQVKPWKELAPADKIGFAYVLNTVITPDGKSYAYSWMRDLSELYVVEGWS